MIVVNTEGEDIYKIKAVDKRFWHFRGAFGECWLGPVTAPWGSSPYMDWYNEVFYIHARARAQ